MDELHTWEQQEGGKLILANAAPLFTADEVAVLFTTLSARLPSAQAVLAIAAPAAAVSELSSARRPRRPTRLTTTRPEDLPAADAPTIGSTSSIDVPWSELASHFLARNFQPLSTDHKRQMRSQGIPSDMVDAATHLHTKSGQCHQGRVFATAAVDTYKDFLQMKAQHDDAACQIWIDEVWHTHLQDVCAYQRDCAALLGDGTLIEHAPVFHRTSSGSAIALLTCGVAGLGQWQHGKRPLDSRKTTKPAFGRSLGAGMIQATTRAISTSMRSSRMTMSSAADRDT